MSLQKNDKKPLAIVGIGCRFPGNANTPETFWKNLYNGKNAVIEVSPRRWNTKQHDHPDTQIHSKTITRWSGFIDAIADFDAAFFGITPQEALRMDPQQRWLLEVTWEALENACIPPENWSNTPTGVFIGLSNNDYATLQTPKADQYTNSGCARSSASGCLSYIFDFRGPSLSIDTACSSALVAVHLACQSIWGKECDAAIAGGVNALLSPDSPIHAVICSTIIHQDSQASTMTVPVRLSQEAMLREAYGQANIDPSHVSYVEAHGSGTPVGDPIEAQAIGNILSQNRTDKYPCFMGSVKTNIGHLEAASGIAGLIKTALILKNQCIPPNLHFQTPNPAIPFDQLRLKVPIQKEPNLPTEGKPLIAAVNSLGFGGTNAHVILEQAPSLKKKKTVRPYLLPISARTLTALRDFIWTAGQRKSHYNQRLAITGESTEELRQGIKAFLAGRDQKNASLGQIFSTSIHKEKKTLHSAESKKDIVFVFTGQVDQWRGMAHSLLKKEPVFRKKITQCSQIFHQYTSDWSLIEEMKCDKPHSDIKEKQIAQSAIFALQIGLVALWKSWGIQAAIVVGLDVGEIAAAYTAGIYSLEDAICIVYHRSRFQNMRQDKGSLPAVREALLHSLESIQPQPASVPFYSTVKENTDSTIDYGPKYWWKNFSQPVRFEAAIHAIIKKRHTTFLELGPHPSLKSTLSACLNASGRSGLVLESLRRKENNTTTLIRTLAILYTNGYLPDWQGLLGKQKGNHMPLPSYPWQKERYWLESNSSRAYRLDQEMHPLLGLRQDTPQPTWECLLDIRTLPYLEDYRLRDSLVFPASAYVEMALAAAQTLFPGKPRTVEPITFLKTLFLRPDQPVTLRFSYDKNEQSFTIHSALANKQDDWQLNAQGCLRTIPQKKPPPVDIHTICSSLPEKISHTASDSTLKKTSYRFGSCFQAIQTIWRGRNESLATIEVPEKIQHNLQDYQFHPAILDACFQCAQRTQEVKEVADPSLHFHLPKDLERICLYQKPSNTLYCHAQLFNKEESLQTNISIYDKKGQIIATIRHFQCHRIEQKNTKRATQYDDALYRLCWEKKSIPTATPPKTKKNTLRFEFEGQWVIFGNQKEIDAALVQKIESQGGYCYKVFPGETFAHLKKNSFQIHPEKQADIQALFSAIGFTAQSLTKLKGIIYLWPLNHYPKNSISVHDLEKPQQTGCLPLIFLAQELIKLQGEKALSQPFNEKNDPRIWIVTHGTHESKHSSEAQASAQLLTAPVKGFVNVAHSEMPSFRWTVIELDTLEQTKVVPFLCAEIASDNDERKVLLGNDKRWVQRLQPVAFNELPFHKKEVSQNPVTPGWPLPYQLKINQPGTLKKLSLNETYRRDPRDNEIEIAVKAASLNFRDVMKVMGIYPGNDADLLWLGDECAGTVVSVGKNVSRFKTGDEVIAIAPYCFRSYALTEECFALPKPKTATFEEASTLPIAFLTAHYALNRFAHLQLGEKILIHAGAGGVGQAAIQIAQQIGAEIFTTVGSKEKRQYLQSQGIQHVLYSRSLDFADDIEAITQGKGVDVVLNSLAGAFIPQNLRVLAPYGRFLEIGKVDIYQNNKIGLKPFKKNLSFFAIDLAACLRERPKIITDMLVELQESFETKKLCPLPHQRFPITQASTAFRYMAKARHIGKVVLSTQVTPIAINPPNDSKPIFKKQAAYLITGGLSGFGLETAKWMADQGARHLFLIGRSGVKTQEAQTVLDALRKKGVQVKAMKADVTIREELKVVLGIIHAQKIPLKGIIHSAMVLDDGFIHQLDKERLDKVLGPKMIGAWLLHEETLEENLDYFICFSSISSVIGVTGQANYNAANTFLEALATYRRSIDLPALTLNWAPLAGAGYVAKNAKIAKYLENVGLKNLDAQEALFIMGHILRKNTAQLVVSRIDWQKLAQINPTVKHSPTFSVVLQHTTKK